MTEYSISLSPHPLVPFLSSLLFITLLVSCTITLPCIWTRWRTRWRTATMIFQKSWIRLLMFLKDLVYPDSLFFSITRSSKTWIHLSSSRLEIRMNTSLLRPSSSYYLNIIMYSSFSTHRVRRCINAIIILLLPRSTKWWWSLSMRIIQRPRLRMLSSCSNYKNFNRIWNSTNQWPNNILNKC